MRTVVMKFVMLAAMLLANFSTFAYDFEVDGIYYNITSMSNLEVEVTFKKIDVDVTQTWNQTYVTSCRNYSYSGEISIPDYVNYDNKTYEVTKIGEEAFGVCPSNYGYPNQSAYYGSNISSISLPNSIKCIGKNAFARCKNLKSVVMPNSLQSIEDEAFYYSGLQSVESWGNITIIGKSSFYATSLEILLLPNTLTTIGDYAFNNNHQLRKVVIGQNVDNIGKEAFANTTSLLEVFYLPLKALDNYKSIFSGHSAMEIYVPSTLICGFGQEFLTFPLSSFDYTGQSHNIEWSNNLKAYKCEIAESECQTDVNAGEYAKNLKATYSDGVDFSVEIPYSYTINKAPMSLTVNNAQREYGDPNPAFTCEIFGFVNGETEQTLRTTPLFECIATQLSKVGDYRILASLEAPNYEITYKYGTLSVIKAPLEATVLNTSKIYGNNNPAFSLSFSGLKNNESTPEWSQAPQFFTTATTSSSVGQYEVTVAGGMAVNYEVTTYNPGTLTITKRDLTAKANDCERLYDEENPEFKVSYIGFVNGDTESSLTQKPIAECNATKSSNAGSYPIVVTGGEAENYNLLYQDGTLRINPLTVGFKDVYNSVTYNDMTLSTSDSYFNYIPEITGPFNDDDFWIELWVLDKDNKYDQHVTTITGGDYAGNYVNTNVDRPMWAGKYIFNLTSKGTNPNVTANPARAYLTVNRASNNLEWNAESPISVKVGEKVDLGITYQADLWCTFNTEYDEDLIELSSEGATGNDPHWFASGLKEGETTLYFSIECKKNDLGFYDFTDSRTLSKRIKVEPSAGIEGVVSENDSIAVTINNGAVLIYHKNIDSIVRVFNMQGTLVKSTKKSEIRDIDRGMYIITVENRSFKVVL